MITPAEYQSSGYAQTDLVTSLPVGNKIHRTVATISRGAGEEGAGNGKDGAIVHGE